MDLEAESIISVDTGMSADIAKYCNKLLETQKQILKTEEELTKLKEVEDTLSEQTIPNLMQQAGVQLLKLSDGHPLKLNLSIRLEYLNQEVRKLLLGFVKTVMVI